MDHHGKNQALEGLRGIAALVVVLSHCAWAFFPYLQSGVMADKVAGWEPWLQESPLRVLYNGTFSVAIFFAMSGYVLTRKYFAHPHAARLDEAAVKRLPRLGIPVFASVMLGYAVMRLGLVPDVVPNARNFLGDWYHINPRIYLALKDALFGSLLYGHQGYNYILWTINIEFIGSISLFAFMALFGSSRCAGIYALLCAGALVWRGEPPYLLSALFLGGAYLHAWPKPPSSPVVRYLLLAFALVLGGFHALSTSYQPLQALAAWLAEQRIRAEPSFLFPSLGALLLTWLVLHSKTISAALSSKPLAWLGSISFSLYLTHSFVLSSIGLASFGLLLTPVGYQTAALLASLLTVVASLGLSTHFRNLVDLPAIRLARRFAKWSLSRDTSASPQPARDAAITPGSQSVALAKEA
ncbi:acyltransferase family protein [Dyella subtropica]|uniref:acyltransferase family protein n=1 Tax=Dyella subtropica TaxID=2992127 RepID=UPI00225939E5|nr:acyltransferase [Dyella subtropica]